MKLYCFKLVRLWYGRYVSSNVKGRYCLTYEIGKTTRANHNAIRAKHGILTFKEIEHARTFARNNSVDTLNYAILKVKGRNRMCLNGALRFTLSELMYNTIGELNKRNKSSIFAHDGWPLGSMMFEEVTPVEEIENWR